MSGMHILDFEEARQTDSGTEPQRILIETGNGKPVWKSAKEFWAAVKSAKDFGIIGKSELPGVVPMAK